jgi:hypothetical protein
VDSVDGTVEGPQHLRDVAHDESDLIVEPES